MPITFQATIDAARFTLNDAAKIRNPDAKCLVYLNDGLYTLCQYRADMFIITGDIPCTAGQVEQIVPAGSVALIDVMAIKGGGAIDRTDIDSLRSYRASWRTDPAAPAQNWAFAPEDPEKQTGRTFIIYPQAPANQILTGQWIQTPTPCPIGQIGTAMLPVPDTYVVALEAYIIFRCEMEDDEHVTTERGVQFFAAFEKAVMLGDQSEKAMP